MTSMADTKLSNLIKDKAREVGFDLCGIAPSKMLKEHELVIRKWCSSGMNGDMNYLGHNIEKRVNPAILFKGAKSVIVVGLNYYTDKMQGGGTVPKISRYAYGTDYHDVVKEKLSDILAYLKIIKPDANGKCFVDTAPIIEKAWAREAGLGMPGRNSILINNKIGSFFFIGIIITDIELDYDEPLTEDYCVNCRVCINSCPTGAINENRTIDARKCISYITVESKGPIPEDLISKMDGRAFGCDKCQDVCPWNLKAQNHNTSEFTLSEELGKMNLQEWQDLTGERFNSLFENTAIARRTYERFKRNIETVTKL